MLMIKVALWIEGCKRAFHDRWPDGLRNESGSGIVETVVIVAAGAAIAIAAMAAIAAAVELKVGSIQL
jgi:hypothetical protein